MKIFKNKVVMWALAITLIAFILLVVTKESNKKTVSTWDSITGGLDSIFR